MNGVDRIYQHGGSDVSQYGQESLPPSEFGWTHAPFPSFREVADNGKGPGVRPCYPNDER